MTKYRLKDQDLQHHLDAISGGDFSDVLNANDLDFDEDGMTEIAFGSSSHGKTFIAEKFSVTLLKDEISFQYDPNAWNSFPEVTPPEGVRMRGEKNGKDGRTIRDCAVYKNGHWIYDSAYPEKVVNPCWWMSDVDRFRPWN